MPRTSLDKTLKRLGEKESTVDYVGRLVKTLGDPSEWKYTGKCVDAGRGAAFAPDGPKCACGHPIRYQFFIYRERDGKVPDEEKVGSTCIGHFAAMNPVLYQELLKAISELEQEKKAKERAAREAERQVKVDAAREGYRRVYDYLYKKFEVYDDGEFLPRPLFLAFKSYSDSYRLPHPDDPPTYQRAHAYVNWYAKKKKYAESIVKELEGSLPSFEGEVPF